MVYAIQSKQSHFVGLALEGFISAWLVLSVIAISWGLLPVEGFLKICVTLSIEITVLKEVARQGEHDGREKGTTWFC